MEYPIEDNAVLSFHDWRLKNTEREKEKKKK